MKIKGDKICIEELTFDSQFTLSDMVKLEDQLKVKLRGNYNNVKYFEMFSPKEDEVYIELVFKDDVLNGLHVLSEVDCASNDPFSLACYQKQVEHLQWLETSINKDHWEYFTARFQDDSKSGYPHLWIEFK